MTCPMPTLPGGWRKVVFMADCLPDENGEPGPCPCGLDYADECVCPGPTEDGVVYQEVEGLLYGKVSYG